MFQDPDTGLVYCRNRWYHPESKQFLTPDPLGVMGSGQDNVYGYAGNDPLNAADPDGLDVVTRRGSLALWEVQSPEVTANGLMGLGGPTTAGHVLGVRSGSGVKLDPRFGGGYIGHDALSSAASSVFKQDMDLSGLTRQQQEQTIRQLIQGQRGAGGAVAQATRQGWAVESFSTAAEADYQRRLAEQEALLKERDALLKELGFDTVGEFNAWNARVEDIRERYVETNAFHAGVIRSGAGVLTLLDTITPDWGWGEDIAEERDLLWQGTSLDQTTAGRITEIGLILSREAAITVATLGLGATIQAARAPAILTGAAYTISQSARARFAAHAVYAGLLTYETSHAVQSVQTGVQSWQNDQYGEAAFNFGLAGLGVLGLRGAGGRVGGARSMQSTPITSAAQKYTKIAAHSTELATAPPTGWRKYLTLYRPKFINHRITPSPAELIRSGRGRYLNHELKHFSDAVNHPEFFYFARVSKAPGSGIAHVIFETRGYLQSHGLRALNPAYAMRSVRAAGRQGLVYRDIGILSGLGISGGISWWVSE